MAQITGRGTLLGFGTTTGWAPKYISIGGVSPSREDLKTTHLGTAATAGTYWDTFKPGDMVDGGEFTTEIFWEPENGFPPIGVAPETITATYPDTGAATVAFSGYVKAFEILEAVVDGLLRMSVTIKVAGAITYTA